MQFWVPSTILRTEKKYKCNSNWISEWWISLFVVIVFVLITYYVTSPCWWCSHILWRPWPRFKNKKSFRKDEYMFLFDGMPCQKWLGLTMATLWSVSITIPFCSATLPVNDLCFLIMSWSLEHASIFLTWAQNQSNLLAKKILPLWKENHLFTAYMYYCWYAVLVGW